MDRIICYGCRRHSREYVSTEALHRHWQRCHDELHGCDHCAPADRRRAAVRLLERAADRLAEAGIEKKYVEEIRTLVARMRAWPRFKGEPVRLIQHGLDGAWDCIGPEGELVAGPFATHAEALAWATKRGATG